MFLIPFLTLLLAPVVYSIIRWYRLRQLMPPGPLGLPWIGNKHQIPSYKPWKKFEEWNKRYGPVASIMLGSTPTIFLGKAQAAWDLLEKRSEIYSSRPRFVVASEILSENRRGLMLSNSNELWKHWRKLLHNGFHVRKVHVYHNVQSMESKVLIYQLMTDPDNFDGYLKRFAASVVLAATYGRRVESVDEWVVRENISSMDYLSSLPGKFLAESWPWLLYLPRRLQWFRAGPEAQKKKDEHLLTSLLDDVRSRMRQGTCPDCLTSQALEEREKKVFEMSDIQLAYAVSSPFGAGIDTTAGGLSVFIVAMLLFPEVMKKAQEELDSVVGPDRMPEFHDKDRLPYVCATMFESLRWRPIAVLGGTAHASSADDFYDGMFIPKGSTVYANMYGILREESLFPEPDRFIPERFLVTPISSKATDSPTTLNTSEAKFSSNSFISSLPQHPRMTLKDFDLPFGFGRRICPGMHLGQNSLFIVIARMLWAFDIQPAKNEKGEEVLPDPHNFTNQFNSKPGPFRAQFIPRSSRIPALVEAEWENAKSQMENWQ